MISIQNKLSAAQLSNTKTYVNLSNGQTVSLNVEKDDGSIWRVIENFTVGSDVISIDTPEEDFVFTFSQITHISFNKTDAYKAALEKIILGNSIEIKAEKTKTSKI